MKNLVFVAVYVAVYSMVRPAIKKLVDSFRTRSSKCL